jgi:hypothetical protein
MKLHDAQCQKDLISKIVLFHEHFQRRIRWFTCSVFHSRTLKKLASFFEHLKKLISNRIYYNFKTKYMGQNKLNKKQENIVKADNPSRKEHKGDTERSSDQGRKAASGGRTDTNNRGHQKDTPVEN